MIEFNNMLSGPAIKYAFPTPIYTCTLNNYAMVKVQEELGKIYNDLISKDKFKHNAKSSSHMVSDIAFKDNLLDDYNAVHFKDELKIHINHYMSLIERKIDTEYTISSSWMALNQKSSYAVVHSHGDSDLSGVYYFKTNTNDGNLFFETPNKMNKANYCFRHYATNLDITPQVGNIILFPGWLEHGVGTNHTDNDRVSLSFNINFKR